MKNKIFNIINGLKDYDFNNGNCGIFAIAIAKILNNDVSIGFILNNHGEKITDINNILYGDYEVRHVIVKYKKLIFDGMGEVKNIKKYDIQYFKLNDRVITAILQNTAYTYNIKDIYDKGVKYHDKK